MKLMQYITIVLLILYPNIIMAQSIKDISRNDANYKLINNAIKNGYFSLYKDNSFQPNTPLSRRDAAIIINRLETKLNKDQGILSREDSQELLSLSNSFKALYNQTNNKLLNVQNENKRLHHEQKIILHDLTELQVSNQRYKKERKLLFGLIAVSTLVGFLFP